MEKYKRMHLDKLTSASDKFASSAKLTRSVLKQQGFLSQIYHPEDGCEENTKSGKFNEHYFLTIVAKADKSINFISVYKEHSKCK